MEKDCTYMNALAITSKISHNSASINEFHLKQQITSLVIDSSLIDFMSEKVQGLKKSDEKMRFLYYCRKVILQNPRCPDSDHFRAFEDEYRLDSQLHNPLKWIQAELEYLDAIDELQRKQDELLPEIEDAKSRFAKKLLTSEDMMKMWKISRSTLNRRISEGMPCHRMGKFTLFDIEEVSRWLKEAA